MSAIKSIASLVTPKQDRRTALASLIEFDKNDDLQLQNARAFQYFPETISDSRDIDFKAKDVAGGSHPIYQWINSGSRRISFEATFSNEEAPPSSGPGGLGGFAQQVENIGSTISGIVKNPVSAAIGAIKGKDASARWSVPVDAAIAWLRSMTYPLYPENQRTGGVIAPSKLLLVLPNSGITSGVGGSSSVQSGTVPVIMTRCDVTYEAFFRSGHPRIATVSLEFIETIQVGKSWGFVGRDRIFNSKNAQHSYETYTLQDRTFSAQDLKYKTAASSRLKNPLG